MLPAALLCVDTSPGEVRPKYLRSADEPWVARALSEYRDREGMPRGDFDDAWAQRVEPALVGAGARRRAAEGLKYILDRAARDRIASTAAPETLRAEVFPLAASGLPRDEVLAKVAERLGLCPEDVEAGLFADVPRARAVVPPAALDVAAWMEKYNLALVQGLLLRSSLVTVELRELARGVVRYAKLRGLLAMFRPNDTGLHMELSGPLSLFRSTLKYGHALAQFLPAVCSSAGYHLEARCALAERESTVVVRSGDPLPRLHTLPKEVDSAVEKALLRDLRRMKTRWTVARETTALRAGDHLFFPDFTLSSGSTRVFVEVVGFYTQEYLRRKLAAVASAGAAKLVLCVSDALEVPFEGDIPGAAACLRYKRRVDAAALIEVVEGVAAEPPAGHS